jgi:hypothetical protein
LGKYWPKFVIDSAHEWCKPVQISALRLILPQEGPVLQRDANIGITYCN